MSRIPEEFTAGDAVTWTDTAIPEGASSATAYIRGNAPAGVTLSGSLGTDGWDFTLAGPLTADLPPGEWTAQTVAVVDGERKTISTLRFRLLASLAYTGTPEALDLRTQARRDLDAVEAAIRALVSGAQEYRIGFGNQGRTVRRADLSELIEWRGRLRAEVAAEERKASGRTDRGIYVQFTPWA